MSWEQRFDELCTCKEQNGHCNVSRYDEQNKSLGKWVHNQRQLYKKNTLSSDRIQKLDSIGIIWDHPEHAWNEHFDQLCTFKAQNGHCNVSQNDEQNKSLGKWVNQQRVLYKKNALSSDRIQRLNSIGIIWDLRNQSIGFSLKAKNKFDELCAFKAQNGHCNVSTLDEQNKSLGKWVSQQRLLYKKKALDPDCIRQLNSIGFIWDLCDHSWNEHFNQLCAFKAQNGHCNVTTLDAQNRSLGKWVYHQRKLYKKNALNPDRLLQLNSIGFIWDLSLNTLTGTFSSVNSC
eukprot:5283132-Ditylum_brightwellii.AAC.1